MRDRDEPIAIRGARVHNLEVARLRPAPEPAGRDHRAFRIGQEQPGLRHAVRRGPAALRGEPLRLRAPVPGPDGEARRRVRHPDSARPSPSSSGPTAQPPALDRGHGPSEVYDHLRVLFAALGKPHCPRCGRAITAQSAEQVGVITASGGANPEATVNACSPRSSAAGRAPSARRWRGSCCSRRTAACEWTAAWWTVAEAPALDAPAGPPHRGGRGPPGAAPRDARNACATRWRPRSTSAGT